MNSKRTKFIWAAFLILLAGCKEINGTVSFKENGSGILKIEMVTFPNESNNNTNTCSIFPKKIKWNDTIYDKDKCIYIYYFNNFDDAETIHKSLGIKLDKLTNSKEHFTYKANNERCIKKEKDEKDQFDFSVQPQSITWSLKPPGNIVLHNANKIIGNTLTWNISALDCYDVFVESDFSQSDKKTTPENSLDDKNTMNTNTNTIINYPGTKDEEKPPDWTAIGASIATIIATVIAYFTYIAVTRRL